MNHFKNCSTVCRYYEGQLTSFSELDVEDAEETPQGSQLRLSEAAEKVHDFRKLYPILLIDFIMLDCWHCENQNIFAWFRANILTFDVARVFSLVACLYRFFLFFCNIQCYKLSHNRVSFCRFFSMLSISMLFSGI